MNQNVARVSTDDVRAYLGGLTLKDSSLQTVMATLRSFFAWLQLEEIIKKNPMNRIHSAKKAKLRLRKYLTAEELEQLRQAAGTKRDRALVEVFFSTGCRLSEVERIRLPDIDFKERSIRVLGKGGKERVVYFSMRAQLLTLDYINSRQMSGGGALFRNTRAPYGSMSARSIQKAIKALGKAAALRQPAFPHKLRHTMAVLAHNNGMAITALQKILGHEHLSTTQIYADINMTNVRHEYERCIS
jgi:integrase/recombinase XerD